MTVEIVSSTILPEYKMEQVILMDDYGCQFHVCIPTDAAEARQSILDQNVAGFQAKQDEMEAYAAQHGHDLSDKKASGMVKKQELVAINKPLPFSPTPAPVTPPPAKGGK